MENIENEKYSNVESKERKKTDEILIAERQIANISFVITREIADATRKQECQSTGLSLSSEQKDSDRNLKAERQRSDTAIDHERSRIDGAIDQDRENKNEEDMQLLAQERDETDRSLSDERLQADSRVGSASSRLSNEIAEHSKTKISLTTREEFLAIVSHDLRNPMGAISSCAEMLLEEPTVGRMDTETKRWIEFIKRNVDASLRMISDILDMERIAENKLALSLKEQRISEIIKDSIENFIYVAAAKRILIRVSSSHVSRDIVCDRDRIQQVLSNFINNALKFTPEGGSIIISARMSDTELIISVKDTGPGIPEEKKKQIFERFAQLKSKDRSGLGLGLYISRMLVEAHGGRIWVESTFGEGSTFFFAIPR